MHKLLAEYRTFDSFIIMQLFVVAINCFSWSLIIPIIIKLQGLLWTTSLISAFMIINNFSAFISPFFKELSLKKSYAVSIQLTVIYWLSLLMYFVDVGAFLIFESILTFCYGIIMSIFSINYDAYLMKTYDESTFKSVQYMERMVMAAASIVGLTYVAIIDIITSDLNIVVGSFFFILFFALCIKIYNYRMFWREIA